MRKMPHPMGMAKKKKKYAHNPHYCMIRPDPKSDGDDIVPTGQS